MVFDVSVALTWILFLALFPMAFFWLRGAWRILRGDYSDVALKRGVPPAEPARYAPYAMMINLLAGGIAVATIVGVLFFHLAYDSWTAIAGVTIWCKFFANFILSRHAHAGVRKNRA